MKIKFIVERGSGVSYHRLYTPLNNIAWDKDDVIEMGIYGEDENPNGADILFFNRTLTTSIEELIKYKKGGLKIIVDIDDYWELHPSHYLYDVWENLKYGKKMLEYIKVADIVLTTTKTLANKIFEYNKNVFIVPNSISSDVDNTIPGSCDKTKFISVTSITHKHDINLLRVPFIEISKSSLKHKSEFILAGYDNRIVNSEWDNMKNVFEQTTSYKILSALPLENYMDLYNEGNVSLIPLVENNFNIHKSELKIIESGYKGLPCIVSNVLPYSQINGPGILFVNNQYEWFKHIKYCINNPNWITDKGKELQEFINKNYNCKQISESLHELFKSILC